MELDNDKYSKNNKKYIILLSYFLCILGFIMIVIGTVFGLKNPYYDSDKYNKIIYAGYKFYIPKSCTTTIKDDIGLIVMTEDNDKYVIGVDYTNSFEDYRDNFDKVYYASIDELTTKIEGKEYLISMIVDINIYGKGGRYVTTSNNQVFSGIVIKNKLVVPVQDDFIFLNDIIKSAKKVSKIKKGSKDDIGRLDIEMKRFIESDYE